MIAGALVAVIAPLILAVHFLLEAWALSHLWAWFIEPVFGLACPSYPHLIGINLVAAMLTHHYQPQPKEKATEYGALIYVFSRPALLLTIGYVVRQWFM